MTVSPCAAFVLSVGPTVVTRADPWPPGGGEQRGGGRPGFSEVFPPGSVFTLDAVAALFSRTPNAVRQLAFQHARELDPPRYWQPRRKGDFRYYRVLSERDVLILRRVLFGVVLEKKPPVKEKMRPVSP